MSEHKKPEVKLTLKAGGSNQEGEIKPQIGTTLEIKFAKVVPKLNIDYTGPDSLKIGVDGTFTIKSIGSSALNLNLGAGFNANLFDGKTQLKGSAEWEINKNVSVKVETNYSDEKQTAIAGFTLKF